MGLKAAAHEQRMASWCIGMPCEHYVCGCESATYGVRVAAPDAGLVCELRSRSVLGLSSLVKRVREPENMTVARPDLDRLWS